MIPDSTPRRDAAWKSYLWGGVACGFGETIMHPVDTLKTRLQSGTPGKTLPQIFKSISATDGVRGLYRGVVPGVTGSFITGATYFGFIESTRDWLQDRRPNIPSAWALFVAGATGDTLGSIVYVPCEVMKQRMQVQGSRRTWEATKGRAFEYYTGVFHAARAIGAQEGVRGLYAGLLSTLARDIPFAGLQIVFYDAFKTALQLSEEKSAKVPCRELSSAQGLVLGGLAGGLSAFLTTPLDVIKTRMQVQSTQTRYSGWLDALQKIFKEESLRGLFKGCGPRVMWWCPASALTFMAYEKLCREFNSKEFSTEASLTTALPQSR